MSKRMIRLIPGLIFEKLENQQGISLNAVMQNGETCFGTLSAIARDSITVLDTRRHSHKLLISNIFEVIYDYQNK
jgi:hypothetical protein